MRRNLQCIRLFRIGAVASSSQLLPWRLAALNTLFSLFAASRLSLAPRAGFRQRQGMFANQHSIRPAVLGLVFSILGAGLAAAAGLSAGLNVIPGPVNGAVIERNGKMLAVYGDPSNKLEAADTLLLVEARRDVVWVAQELARRGAKVIAPEREAELLNEPGKFWAEFREKRFHDYSQRSSKVPVEPIPVSRAVKGGEVIQWEDISIRVIDTPGTHPAQ